MMIFLVFSHYQHATDAFYYRTCLLPHLTQTANNLLYDLFTLTRLFPLMWQCIVITTVS